MVIMDKFYKLKYYCNFTLSLIISPPITVIPYYLYFGLHGKNALMPWIWTAIPLNILATIILTFHKLRNNFKKKVGYFI